MDIFRPSKPIPLKTEKKSIPPALRWAVFKRDGYKCRKCGCETNLHCDHVYPESKGGKTVMENLQTLCWRCNISKSDSVEVEII